MKKFLSLLWVLLLAFSCKDPVNEQPQSLSHDYDAVAPTAMSFSVREHSLEGRMALSWQSGERLLVVDDASASASHLVARDAEIAGEKWKIPYQLSASGARKVFVSYLGSNPSVNGLVAEVSPALDGRLSEAGLSNGSADVEATQVALSLIVGIVKFSLERKDVSKIVISEDGDVFPESFRIHLQKGEVEAVRYCHSIEVSAGSTGDYYLPVMPGAPLRKLTADLYDMSGKLLHHTEISNDMDIASGRIYGFGDIGGDGSDPGPGTTESILPVPMLFKQDGKELDYTSAGAVWPFKEGKGSFQNQSSERVFHTYDGYAVFFSGERHYLHSGNGWVVWPRKKTDYIELPAFSKGRIQSVSIAFGESVCNPSFVDSEGRILAGGGQRETISSGTLYRYEFEDTRAGEPCRMVFNTAERVSILQVTPVYVFNTQDMPPASEIKGVYLWDDANSLFSSGAVGVRGALKTDGGGMSGIRCGVQYADYTAEGEAVEVACDPASFRCVLDSPSSTKYSFRAWAASENGWREYTDMVLASPYSLLLDFWKEGALSKAIGDTPFDPSGEQSRAVSGTDYSVCVKGAFAYDASAGLSVSSSGGTYIKFPAISGKTLSEVLVLAAPSSGAGDLLVCLDPANPSSSSVSSVYALSPGSSDPISISCSATMSDTAYSLVFASAAAYQIRRITAVYFSPDAPSTPPDEDEDDPSADPAGLFDYSVLSGMSHPRLFLDAAGFSELKQRITSRQTRDLLLSEVNELILSYANIYTSKVRDITYTLDASGKRLLEESQSALLQLSSLSYAYRMTGNTKYLQRAKAILAQVCAFPDWHPSHFLDTAEMTLAVALAYDWLYNALTLDERKLIREKIVAYGLTPGLRDDYVTTVNNWNQVCCASMVAGALAIYEKNKQVSYETIERNVPSNISVATQIYSPDGNYAEGYGYWMYGTGFQAMMMKLLESVFGQNGGMDTIPGLDKTAEYMLFMDGLTASFSYADGGDPAGWAAKIAIWYLAAKSGDRSLLTSELRLLKNGAYSRGIQPRMLFLLPTILKDFPVSYDAAPHHSKNIWSGRGKTPVVMVHTGWRLDDSDHYLGIKAGAASDVGHAHMDAGSFVYDALGKRWSTDVGKMDYATMENAFKAAGGAGPAGQNNLRWDVLKLNNYGHSTISVEAHDGSFLKRYPTDHKYAGAATVSEIIETSSELGAVLDMSDPLAGSVQSATRTIKLVDERDLVIIDVITAKEHLDAPIRWHMITPASITVKDGYEILTQDDKTMYLTATAQPSVSIRYLSDDYIRPASWIARTWDEAQTEKISGFAATVPAGTTVTFRTILSPTHN